MFFYQLINALEYIHSLGIAHRDLKPENLLLVENKIIKIIDFGLSNYFNGEKNLETPCGSPSYASPEIIKGEAYNGFYIDIWASGIIMFAMLCGYLPFDDDEEENEDDENEVNTSDNIKRSDRTSRVSNESEKSEDNEVLFQRILEGKLEFPSYLTPEAVDLMKKILVVDPTKRIEIKDIKKHKFYLIGQKNFLLNKKNISIPKVKKIKKIEKIEEQLNDTDNDALKDEDEFLNSLSKDLIHSIMDNLNGKNDSTHNIHNSNPNHDMNNSTNDNNKASAEVNKNEDGDKKNKVKVLLNKDDMEEYEKKLFENYLRNVAAIRRNNLLMNKLKKQNNPKNKKINKLKIYSNPLSINFNPLSIYSPGLHQNVRDIQNIPRVKKIKKNKNNYTLNEIVLNFNGNNSESYKELTTSISRRINNNYNINNYNILKTKIKPIIRKSYDYYKNNNMFYHIENNKSINKDSHNLLTINIPDEMSSKRRNYTENKLLKDVKYDRTNGNYKKFDESIRKYNYLKNPIYNSVEHIYENNLMRNNNRPILPLIKPSLFNIFSNINNQNKETSLLNPINRLKTEENNPNNRKIFISIGNKIDYNVFWNNSNHSINNDFKYKLFLPSNKRYNISTLKGSYNFNI
jgi:serine/threonine protein kinase